MAPIRFLGDGADCNYSDAGLTVSVHGETAEAVAEIAEDAEAAGYRVIKRDLIANYLANPAPAPADIFVCDCQSWDDARCRALREFDAEIGRSGQKLLVSTNMGLLDQIYWCFDQSNPHITVASNRFERTVALAAMTAGPLAARVREETTEERIVLLRLTEEVGRLAAKLDCLAVPLGSEGPHGMTARLASPAIEYGGPGREPGRDLMRRPRAPLPDPRLVHRIIRQRRLRDRYFESELFADPAWDILLDLTAARAEHRRVAVTSLCIAAAVPATTALRWIAQMTQMGILVREQDEEDKRRAFIALSDGAADAMARYFDELGKDANRLI